MRTHDQIIAAAGGVAATAKAITVDANTVKQWKRSNSIPAPHWKAVSDAGLATLEELADAASKRRTGTDDAADNSAEASA